MIDVVIEEVRKRRRILIKKKYGGSIEKMFESVQSWQRENPSKIINLRKMRAAKAVA